MSRPLIQSKGRSISRILGTAILGVAIAVVITIWRGLSSDEPSAPPPAPPCPERFVDSPGRAEALLARLASVPEGAALARDARQADLRYCFGEARPSRLSGTRVLLLDQSLAETELAARLAHLAHHATRVMPFPQRVPENADCEALVGRALEREAHAYVMELRIGRALGAPSGRYEFEADVFAAPDAEREAIVRRYLEAHPDGGPGIDALASGYRRRCADARL